MIELDVEVLGDPTLETKPCYDCDNFNLAWWAHNYGKYQNYKCKAKIRVCDPSRKTNCKLYQNIGEAFVEALRNSTASSSCGSSWKKMPW